MTFRSRARIKTIISTPMGGGALILVPKGWIWLSNASVLNSLSFKHFFHLTMYPPIGRTISYVGFHLIYDKFIISLFLKKYFYIIIQRFSYFLLMRKILSWPSDLVYTRHGTFCDIKTVLRPIKPKWFDLLFSICMVTSPHDFQNFSHTFSQFIKSTANSNLLLIIL